MVLKDFFHLSDAEFTIGIAQLSDAELLQLDIHNVRAIHSGTYTAAVGAVQAPLTLGISLVGSAIGLRRRHVAKRRLAMLHAEIARRGLEAHVPTKRDKLIPLGVAGVTLGISAGVAIGVERAAGALIEAGVEMAFATAQSATVVTAEDAMGRLGVEMASERVIGERLERSKSESNLPVPVVLGGDGGDEEKPPALLERSKSEMDLPIVVVPEGAGSDAEKPPALPERPRSALA